MTMNLMVASLLAEGVRRLRACPAGSAPGATPELDAQLLLAHVLGVPRVRLRSHPEGLAEPEATRRYRALVERRTAGEPLAYLTGERDDENLILDMQSRRSLDKWCVYDVVTQTEPRTAHELADASAFSRALEALLGPRHGDPGKLEDCRARIDQELRTQLGQVENAFAHGDSNGAKQMLSQIDARYGGLAAPRSVELATQ